MHRCGSIGMRAPEFSSFSPGAGRTREVTPVLSADNMVQVSRNLAMVFVSRELLF